MFKYEKRKFLANSIIKKFHILVYNNEHIMTLKYNKFKCYWAAVTEKTSNSVFREGPSLFRSNSERKIGFFSGHSCL